MRRLRSALVTVLMVAITMNVSACSFGQPPQSLPLENPEYLSLDTPEAPVYNAFWALQQGDVDKAREQYTNVVRAAIDRGTNSFDLAFGTLRPSLKTDKLVILGIRARFDEQPDHVYVKIRQVGIERSFFVPLYFETSNEREVLVTRTEDGWKIDSVELFYDNGSTGAL